MRALIFLLILTMIFVGCIGSEKNDVTTTTLLTTTSTSILETTTTIILTTTSITPAKTTTSIQTTSSTTSTTVPSQTRPIDYEELEKLQNDYKEAETSDMIVLINETEMDRLYGNGYSVRFTETIKNGKTIVDALESYYTDKGKYPNALDDLVPEYLQSIPKTSIQHKEIRYSPYWKNDDNTTEYFEDYQKFWYYPQSNLKLYKMNFGGPNEYCETGNLLLAKWQLNLTQTYPFLCETQSLLMRLKPLQITQKKETRDFILYVPEHWRDNTETFKAYPAYFTENGGFPLQYNGEILMINLWVMDGTDRNLEDMKKDWIDGYKANPDRVFNGKFPTEVRKTQLNSGQDAYFIHVQFYRPFNGLNQSRFDLITVDSKTGKSYNLGLSIQYAGDYDKAESDLRLKELAEGVFAKFELK